MGVMIMKKELLKSIGNSAARKKLRTLLNNGFDMDERQMRDLISGNLKSSYLQVFPTVKEKQIIENINLDLPSAEKLFLPSRRKPRTPVEGDGACKSHY